MMEKAQEGSQKLIKMYHDKRGNYQYKQLGRLDLHIEEDDDDFNAFDYEDQGVQQILNQ